MSFEFNRRALLAGSAGLALAGAIRSASIARAQDGPAFSSPVALPAATPRDGGPLEVVTSTSILADLARQIGGDRVEARSILPANADPHDFEPAPDDVMAIEGADIVLLHGLQLDSWADPLIEASQTDAPVIVVTGGIETLNSDEEEFSDGDPHVWFDPTRVKKMVANIEDGLVSVDPEGADSYRARLEAYDQALDRLDTDIQAQIALIPEERRVLVTNHDALEYYADRYGLDIVGTVIPGLDSRTEPSAKEIADLIELVQESGVTVIFAENTVSPALAESLARDAGVRVAPELYTDSLGDPGSGADTYLGMMETDTSIIVENLRA